MRVTPAGFAALTTALLHTPACPVVAALEGGYNPKVTSECCEGTLRALLGDPPPPPEPQQLSRSCEPTLRKVKPPFHGAAA